LCEREEVGQKFQKGYCVESECAYSLCLKLEVGVECRLYINKSVSFESSSNPPCLLESTQHCVSKESRGCIRNARSFSSYQSEENDPNLIVM
jgi:hypothetical protein